MRPWLVVNMRVHGHATKVLAGPAKFACQLVVIVAKWKRTCFAVIAAFQRLAIKPTDSKRARLSRKHGPGCLNVKTCASADSTAAFTNVESGAIRRIERLVIVPSPLMSLLTALVARLPSTN
jgi:hypothetical protein